MIRRIAWVSPSECDVPERRTRPTPQRYQMEDNLDFHQRSWERILDLKVVSPREKCLFHGFVYGTNVNTRRATD